MSFYLMCFCCYLDISYSICPKAKKLPFITITILFTQKPMLISKAFLDVS